jgi:virginiamycin B lyase
MYPVRSRAMMNIDNQKRDCLPVRSGAIDRALLGMQSAPKRDQSRRYAQKRLPILVVNLHHRAWGHFRIRTKRDHSRGHARRDFTFVKCAFVLYLIVAILLLLPACGNSAPSSSSNSASAPAPVLHPANTTPAIIAIGNFREYPLPQGKSGLMRPAIDHQGRIWFGEMGHNYLASLDPRTHTFEQITPPHGAFGIMGVAVAANDSIWFAEQYANYIGHYFPTTKQFRIYDLPTLTAPDPGNKNATLTLPSAPNEIALDAHGNVWFTELNADSLGMLDPANGHIKQYPLSAHRSIQVLSPYGITIDPQGAVWFTEASTNHIGRLDPRTGKISLYTLKGSNNPFMEIASDAHGNIWATSFNAGLLLKFAPEKGTFTPYYAPYTGNGAGGLYGLLVTPQGEVWTTVTAENVIAQLDVAAGHFIYYQIPTANSLPLGLVMDAQHTIWFTEAASDKIGELKP